MKNIEGKESMVIYFNWIDQLDKIGGESAWKVIKGLKDMDQYGEEPDVSSWDLVEQVMFGVMKDGVRKNREKYEKQCRTNSENGKKGGAPLGNTNASKNEEEKQPKTTENNPKQPKTTENNRKQPKTTDGKSSVEQNNQTSVSVSGSLSVPDSVAVPVSGSLAETESESVTMSDSVAVPVSSYREKLKKEKNLHEDDGICPIDIDEEKLYMDSLDRYFKLSEREDEVFA